MKVDERKQREDLMACARGFTAAYWERVCKGSVAQNFATLDDFLENFRIGGLTFEEICAEMERGEGAAPHPNVYVPQIT